MISIHPTVTGKIPSSEVEALLDAGKMINFARMGYCDCRICRDFRHKETTFANVAQHLYKSRVSNAGKVFRALVEDWSISRIVEEFKMEEVA